jgi:hypothetical protein
MKLIYDSLSAAALPDEEAKRRRAERWHLLLNALEPFAEKLTELYSKMPQIIMVDLHTAELTQYIQPEWHKMIDMVIRARNEMVKQNFPEFYRENEEGI